MTWKVCLHLTNYPLKATYEAFVGVLLEVERDRDLTQLKVGVCSRVESHASMYGYDKYCVFLRKCLMNLHLFPLSSE